MEATPTEQDIQKVLKFNIYPQPDDLTCGPTCLHAVYNFFGDPLHLTEVINSVKRLEHGGTLAVFLGQHALLKGYEAVIYTYNLQLFDPSWFKVKNPDLIGNLEQQALYKKDKGMKLATDAYIKFLEMGGKIKYQELSPALIRKYLRKNIPILTGLSATYLYDSAREIPDNNQYDSIKGEPAGHFVVINGFDKHDRKFFVSDPLRANPLAESQYYKVSFNRLISSILLGILTYDANLLIIYPKTHENNWK